MKIHSICIVKDEADIVGDAIAEAQTWSDFIYIYDNGSTDGTTEILKAFADKYENVIFYKWSDRTFHNTIRQEVFQTFNHNSSKGDWWCRLDSDEFYIDNPRTFLSNIDDDSDAILHSSYNFYFTDKDLEKFNEAPESFSYKDLHYYKNNSSEIRFVKDNGHLYWPPSSSWPVYNMDFYKNKIRVRHYQYRNPDQIRKRAQNRNLAYKNFDPYKKRNIGLLGKSAILDLENRLVSHKALEYENGNEPLKAGEKLEVWKPADSLPNQLKRSFKNILYRMNLLNYLYKMLGRSQ